eukprot:TRINITY_DN3591_c0_g1_i5.p1 TRINITY_DN3591_c0_g1~~TRINITY_DN3591_c0_g1_i5.p1  ORF type:complete len:268 (+),score=51.63 TRINITY_DN3591_c0_g1_i5:65-868(+)
MCIRDRQSTWGRWKTLNSVIPSLFLWLTCTGFAYQEGRKVNIRNIQAADPRSILQGNNRLLFSLMDDLAYTNIMNDEMINKTEESMKLYCLMQLTMQYLMYTTTKYSNNVFLLQDYLKVQEDKAAKFLDLIERQKKKMKKLKQERDLLNDQIKHYERLVKIIKNSGSPVKEDDPVFEISDDEDGLVKPSGIGEEKGPSNSGHMDLTRKKKFYQPPSDLAAGNKESSVQTLKKNIEQLTPEQQNELRKYVIQQSLSNGPSASEDFEDL